ncbi:MAG TPA: dienelactone hydrolase family protein [Pseudonocardiaceae bacterium]|jgi:dienelactone hydrolase|nr:dienelactone hydrolase family protein [Pseudonocardiaceae bacterium]
MAIVNRALPYSDLDVSLTGALYWDDQRPSAPGLLLIHGGAGLDQHARDQARRYAELGFTVLAADMYGVTGDREAIMGCVTALRDDPAMLIRLGTAALTALACCAEADGVCGAIGFCFGGMAALTLARGGADLPAVVSMHGTLTSTVRGRIGARVLVCHGADDPHVPMSQVVGFAEEMREAEADWRLIMYGRAQHGFTHREPSAVPGVAFDAQADADSFAAASAFLHAAQGGTT